MEPGDEMMIWCRGGPSTIKRQTYPPEAEIRERDGVYVLHDDGDPNDWTYVFLASH